MCIDMFLDGRWMGLPFIVCGAGAVVVGVGGDPAEIVVVMFSYCMYVGRFNGGSMGMGGEHGEESNYEVHCYSCC